MTVKKWIARKFSQHIVINYGKCRQPWVKS